MRAIILAFALVGAVLLAGCTRSPEARAEDARMKLASWQATRRLLDEQRARGDLPEQYVRQVMRAVEEGRAQVRANLRAASAP